MSKSELHDWECEIEELSGNNADKMLGIARDIYKTAFVRGRNSMTWEQTRWIPVSERLPEVHEETYYADHEEILHESDYVLTCCQVGEEFVYAIGTVIHDEVCNSYEWSGLYDYVGYEIDDAQVLAWMPLPKPYKAETESEV